MDNVKEMSPEEAMPLRFGVTGWIWLDKETGMFVAAAPNVRVYSQGDTAEEAEAALNDAVTMYVEEHFKRATFEKQLQTYGWTAVKGPFSMESHDFAIGDRNAKKISIDVRIQWVKESPRDQPDKTTDGQPNGHDNRRLRVAAG